MIILPGTLEYQIAIEHLPLPPDWERWAARTNGDFSIVVIPGTGGLMRCVPHEEAAEFTGDGEFDAEVQAIESSSWQWTNAEAFAERLIV